MYHTHTQEKYTYTCAYLTPMPLRVWESRGQLHLFLTLTLHAGVWWAACHCSFIGGLSYSGPQERTVQNKRMVKVKFTL